MVARGSLRGGKGGSGGGGRWVECMLLGEKGCSGRVGRRGRIDRWIGG